MAKAVNNEIHSQWRRFALALFLCLVFIGVPLLLLTLGSQAYASEEAQAQEQAEETGERVPGYDVYVLQKQKKSDTQSGQTSASIPDTETPLTSPLQLSHKMSTKIGEGSFFNTGIAVLVTLSLGGVFFVLLTQRKKNFRLVALRMTAVAFGLVTIAVWSLIDRLEHPVIFFNEVSVLMALLFTAYAATALASFVYEARISKSIKQK